VERQPAAVAVQPEPEPDPQPVTQPHPEPESGPVETVLVEEATVVEIIDQEPQNVLLPLQSARSKVPLEVEFDSHTSQVIPQARFRQREGAEQPESLTTSLLQPSFDLMSWVNALSGLSLLPGLVPALRRLRQNRRANARRFVRIN
jgi:hypothetical protein